ncbi:hypothetical protein LTR05_000011 [Lithohypha guttulata]|uniref:SAP domain-containing protein n=1 Tax=Lithohypha guttulata TaxID=1690604 RepID=A0AAN7T3U9_9EURO|nr:hypothetical protein LTR05_000011 [Lithohypha guttulata]
MSTDWDKFKVTELKEECKSRKISITGLKLKQQFVEKLVEHEEENSEAQPNEHDQPQDGDVDPNTTTQTQPEQPTNGEGDTVEERTNGAIGELSRNGSRSATPATEVQDEQDNVQVQRSISTGEQTDQAEQAGNDVPATEDVGMTTEVDENLPRDRPAALQAEDAQAIEAESEAQPDDNLPVAETEKEAEEIKKHSVFVPQNEQLQTAEEDDTNNVQPLKKSQHSADHKDEQSILQPSSEAKTTEIVDSKILENEPSLSSSSQAEESRKRKRRSLTPPPNPEEVAKKVKLSDGEAVPTRRASRSPSSTPQSSKIRSSDTRNEMGKTSSADAQEAETEVHSRGREGSPLIDEDSTVQPAMHLATRSLYMKNFKRPYPIADLKPHIEEIARGSPNSTSTESPIQLFHLNNLRSQAFVRFSSISVASRVRSVMHGKKFPDDDHPREPIWVDFVPDEKVEQWIEMETGGSRERGRNSSIKMEVVYNQNEDGSVEAVFEGTNSHTSFSQNSSKKESINQRQASYSTASPRSSAVASGIHHDRAAMVPRSPDDHRRASMREPLSPHGARKPSDRGIGFAGLDDIFSSTTTKPKLYYKLPSPKVVDARLDRVADLYSDRGVSGAPGMKRYTFEKAGEKEIWVDNGPEFGHGKRGQDRLLGVSGRGRGGYRGGRGAPRGGFAGRERDVYRGEGRR